MYGVLLCTLTTLTTRSAPQNTHTCRSGCPTPSLKLPRWRCWPRRPRRRRRRMAARRRGEPHLSRGWGGRRSCVGVGVGAGGGREGARASEHAAEGLPAWRGCWMERPPHALSHPPAFIFLPQRTLLAACLAGQARARGGGGRGGGRRGGGGGARDAGAARVRARAAGAARGPARCARGGGSVVFCAYSCCSAPGRMRSNAFFSDCTCSGSVRSPRKSEVSSFWYGGSELLPQGRCGRHLPPVRSAVGAGRGTGSSHPRESWQRLSRALV